MFDNQIYIKRKSGTRFAYLLVAAVGLQLLCVTAGRANSDSVNNQLVYLPFIRDGASVDQVYAPYNEDGNRLFAQDFDGTSSGQVNETALERLFNDPLWDNGVEEGRIFIVAGDVAYEGQSLEVRYPRGTVGPKQGGGQWPVELGAGYNELYVAYRVRFPEGFDFVKGGKLPGLVGGEANSGGDRPNGRDGWSARMMWTREGKVIQYVYHPDQPKSSGDDMDWDLSGQRYFQPGVWHTVEHRVVMNTPGSSNGLIEGWFDGDLAFRREGLRFRDVDQLAIDALYFSTFFGGSGADWAAQQDESIFFDDFVISTEPITH
ncbi:MAG: polysaccharide lyase [Chloroflexota bacterium]